MVLHGGGAPPVWCFAVVVLCGGGASPVWCLVVLRGFVVVGVLCSLLAFVCGHLFVVVRGVLVSILFMFRLILCKPILSTKHKPHISRRKHSLEEISTQNGPPKEN